MTTDTATKLRYLAAERCGHIREPYTLDEILDMIHSNEYNAELVIQHLLLAMANTPEQRRGDAEPVMPEMYECPLCKLMDAMGAEAV
jgi:hypothetical protein